MKKMLLTMAVALAGMSASATNAVGHAKLVKQQQTTQVAKMDMNAHALPTQLNTTKFAKAPKKAEGDLFANFIYTYPGTKVPTFKGAMEIPFYMGSKTIEYTVTDENGKDQDVTMECNVRIPNFGGYKLEDIYARYEYSDEYECNVLLIPNQLALHATGTSTTDGTPYDESYYIVGLDKPKEGKYTVYNTIMLFEEEDGSFTFDADGWGLIVEDNLTNEVLGIALSRFGVLFNKVNATYIYQKSGKEGWETSSDQNCYVADYETALEVCGFLGFNINMNIDENNIIHLPLGTIAVDEEYSGEKFNYGYMRMVGVSEALDEQGNPTGQIKVDEEKQENLGEFIATNAFVINDYFTLRTSSDSEGLAYGMGWFYGPRVELLETNFVAGIGTVKTDVKEQRNNKTYNMMGQQVNAAQKGLVIRNGRKFVNK